MIHSVRLQAVLGRSTFVAGLAALLTACGGGGGSGGSSATLAPFVKFSSITVPGTVVINGNSQQANYTYDTTAHKVTSISAVSPAAPGASYTGTYDSAGNVTKASFTSAAGTTITIDTSKGDIVRNYSPIAIGVTANGQDSVITPIPAALGWDYQAFGVWTTGGGTGSGTVGAVTVGAETSGASIPTTGTATYSGLAMGQYTDTAGTPYYTVAGMTANTDFSARSIAFSTSNSSTINQSTGAQTAASSLNMSGTLTYAAGNNLFTGNVSTVGGGASGAAMTGTATGKFYGPSAQEIGGTFGLTSGTVGAGGTGYIGAFGGKR